MPNKTEFYPTNIKNEGKTRKEQVYMLLPLNFLGGTLFLSPGGHFFDVRGYLGGQLGDKFTKKTAKVGYAKKASAKIKLNFNT